MRAGVLAMAAAAALAACGTDAPSDAPQPQKAQACAVRHCECVSSTIPVFFLRETRPVAWRANGDAYCPEGFVLSLTGKS